MEMVWVEVGVLGREISESDGNGLRVTWPDAALGRGRGQQVLGGGRWQRKQRRSWSQTDEGTEPNSESLSFLICKIGIIVLGLRGGSED